MCGGDWGFLGGGGRTAVCCALGAALLVLGSAPTSMFFYHRHQRVMCNATRVLQKCHGTGFLVLLENEDNVGKRAVNCALALSQGVAELQKVHYGAHEGLLCTIAIHAAKVSPCPCPEICLNHNPQRWPSVYASSPTQHNTTQHNTAQHNTTQHNTTQHNTTQHNTTQHNTTQHHTIPHSTAQHSTAQHSTAQHSATQQHSTAQHHVAKHDAADTEDNLFGDHVSMPVVVRALPAALVPVPAPASSWVPMLTCSSPTIVRPLLLHHPVPLALRLPVVYFYPRPKSSPCPRPWQCSCRCPCPVHHCRLLSACCSSGVPLNCSLLGRTWTSPVPWEGVQWEGIGAVVPMAVPVNCETGGHDQ